MSNTNNSEDVGNLEPYLINALDTNLFFLKVRVTLNIAFHALMFVALAYLLYVLMFMYGEINTATFVKEFIFLFFAPILFKVVTMGGYRKSRNDHYTNIIKNKNEQK